MPLQRFFLKRLIEHYVHSVHLASVFFGSDFNLAPTQLLQQRFDSMTKTSGAPATESVRPRSRSPVRKVDECCIVIEEPPVKKEIHDDASGHRLEDSYIVIESPVKKEIHDDDASGHRLEDSQTPPHWRSDWDPEEDYFVYRQIQQNFLPEARFRSVSTGDVSDRMAELRRIYRKP